MKFLLTQWRVKVNGKDLGMFTPVNCSPEVAMAIAVSTFGKDRVTELENEGDTIETLGYRHLEMTTKKGDSHDTTK